MDKRKLRELLVEHKEHALKAGDYFARQAASDPDRLFAQKEIHTITGVRRSGLDTVKITSDAWWEETIDKVRIDCIPIWKWLLG